MKRIVVLNTDGTERELASVPSLKEMQAILGGWIEHVRVLDHIEGTRGVYTSMFVNETGLIDGLPRNPKATEAYQRNVRMAFPDAENPFRAADEDNRKRFPNCEIIDATPKDAIENGYRDDPWISGPAILFEGWTCEEVEAAS
jgi:hypothetical protein